MINELIEDCLPIIRNLKKGRYAITIGGSRGKGLSDVKSDVDFRVYADDFVDGGLWEKGYNEMQEHIDYWANRGLMIDGVWPRKFSEIDIALDKWLSGKINIIPVEWSVWGYYLPTDIYHQQIIEDPSGIAEGWKKRMNPYPQELKRAVIRKHMNRLRYWKNDYHYKNKIDRKDIVFLASLSASLVHDIMQVLCAVNDLYFPGDGHNLGFAEHFASKPADFNKRIEYILYPENPDVSDIPDILVSQYNAMVDMINDIESIISSK